MTATRYALTSRTFAVTGSTAARVRAVRRTADGSVRATLAFPPAGADDLTPPPPATSVRVPRRRVHGDRVVLPAGSVRDADGNTSAVGVTLPLG